MNDLDNLSFNGASKEYLLRTIVNISNISVYNPNRDGLNRHFIEKTYTLAKFFPEDGRFERNYRYLKVEDKIIYVSVLMNPDLENSYFLADDDVKHNFLCQLITVISEITGAASLNDYRLDSRHKFVDVLLVENAEGYLDNVIVKRICDEEIREEPQVYKDAFEAKGILRHLIEEEDLTDNVHEDKIDTSIGNMLNAVADRITKEHHPEFFFLNEVKNEVCLKQEPSRYEYDYVTIREEVKCSTSDIFDKDLIDKVERLVDTELFKRIRDFTNKQTLQSYAIDSIREVSKGGYPYPKLVNVYVWKEKLEVCCIEGVSRVDYVINATLIKRK